MFFSRFSCSNAWQLSLNSSKLNWQHWKERRVPWNFEAQEWLQKHGNPGQKQCKLPKNLVCDGINHCGDHSDECSANANCSGEKKFICNNSRYFLIGMKLKMPEIST